MTKIKYASMININKFKFRKRETPLVEPARARVSLALMFSKYD